MTDSIYQRLLTEGEKHKGTDLGGLLQVAAHLIDDYKEAMAEKDREIENMLEDCKKMHQGLIDIDKNATTVAGIAFGAMPNLRYIAEEIEEQLKRKKSKK
jgi:hypothetical protein